MSIDDGHTPRPIKPRDLGLNPRCTCQSADPFHPELPPMRHPAHEHLVCGVRMPDGEPCQCGSSSQEGPSQR
jgi:hypothetical protein